MGRDRDLRERDPSALGDLLKKLLKQYRPAVADDPAARLAELNGIWRGVVGDALGEQTRVAKYLGGVMTVEVSSAPLLAELSGFAKQELMDGLGAAGLTGLHELRFRPGSSTPSSSTGGGGAQEGVRN